MEVRWRKGQKVVEEESLGAPHKLLKTQTLFSWKFVG